MAFEQLVDPDLIDGTIAELGMDELLINSDPATDLGVEVGSTVTATFQNGDPGRPHRGGHLRRQHVRQLADQPRHARRRHRRPARDFFVFAKLADGVDPQSGDEAVRAAMAEFPQANVQTNAEFRASQEDQINQLLVIISMLLAFAIFIAILGISITLALGVFERTREIGLLRAVGMNKRQTRRSVRWEAIIVSTFGALIGIVLGTFLGVVLSLAVPEATSSASSRSTPASSSLILVGADHRRAPRRAVPVVQGVEHERPRSDRDRVVTQMATRSRLDLSDESSAFLARVPPRDADDVARRRLAARRRRRVQLRRRRHGWPA